MTPADAGVDDLPVCVIGAGLSGLTAIKQLTDRGIDSVCYEIGSGIGGNWRYNNDNARSAAHASLHVDTSKDRFAYGDLPISPDWPTYLHHSQVLEYLEMYADAFDLERTIRFSHKVLSVRGEGDAWRVKVEDTRSSEVESGLFRAVVVASGHHWDPSMPDFDGPFNGRVMHAQQYKTPQEFDGAHVVVVGLGNTGADIASELSSHATVTLSTRSGAHILPRYVRGRPLDTLSSRFASNLPLSVQRFAYSAILAFAGSSQRSSGIPTPDAPLLSQHPTVSQDLIALATAGNVTVVGDVTRLSGNEVEFADASTVRVSHNEVDMYEMVVPVDVPGLYFVGLIQPVGALPPLAEQQARWVAQLIDGAPLPSVVEMHREIAEQRAQRQNQYLDRPRHTIQVDYWPYLDHMRALCDSNDRDVHTGTTARPPHT